MATLNTHLVQAAVLTDSGPRGSTVVDLSLASLETLFVLLDGDVSDWAGVTEYGSATRMAFAPNNSTSTNVSSW